MKKCILTTFQFISVKEGEGTVNILQSSSYHLTIKCMHYSLKRVQCLWASTFLNLYALFRSRSKVFSSS